MVLDNKFIKDSKKKKNYTHSTEDFSGTIIEIDGSDVGKCAYQTVVGVVAAKCAIHCK